VGDELIYMTCTVSRICAGSSRKPETLHISGKLIVLRKQAIQSSN